MQDFLALYAQGSPLFKVLLLAFAGVFVIAGYVATSQLVHKLKHRPKD
jgi:hypothetical protein